jgi:hypothetical protein
MLLHLKIMDMQQSETWGSHGKHKDAVSQDVALHKSVAYCSIIRLW